MGLVRVKNEGYLYQLTFMPAFFPVNCYFVKESEGLILIDAALPYSAKGIIRTAEDLGEPIIKIILTHAHEDHVGALDALKERYPDAPVYISARDARLMNGDYSLDEGEAQAPIKGGVPKKLKTRADFLLNEGNQIGSLTAFSTPGHTPGSMSFLDNRTGALIGGDALQTRGGAAVAGDVKPLFPFPAFGTWSKETALESAKKIADLKPEWLAIGHGDMVKAPGKVIEHAISHLQQKLG